MNIFKRNFGVQVHAEAPETLVELSYPGLHLKWMSKSSHPACPGRQEAALLFIMLESQVSHMPIGENVLTLFPPFF